jgi:CheY-like chemotaxis protein
LSWRSPRASVVLLSPSLAFVSPFSLSLSQGIGLFLCKSLIELMGGEIRLDNDYNSGVPGCVGTRIIVDLCSEPLDSNSLHEYDASWHDVDSGETAGATLSEDDESFRSDLYKLPATLSVLFVDDDAILRKLFTRTVLTVAPNWDIREASNGETALRLVETQSFDLIFMDMYMASVQKQLLGTEAVKALRSKGVSCRICGLSANDKAREFLEAGADAFTYKPFPCAPRPLTSELCRILYADASTSSNEASSNSHA